MPPRVRRRAAALLIADHTKHLNNGARTSTPKLHTATPGTQPYPCDHSP